MLLWQPLFVKQGVALPRLGSDMVYDFSSSHAEADKRLADVTAERDHLRRNLGIAKENLQDTLGRYRAKRTWKCLMDLEHAQEKVRHANLQITEAEEEVKVAKVEMDNLRDLAQAEKINLVQEREELQKELDSAAKDEKRYQDEITRLEKDVESTRKEHKGNQASHDSFQKDLFHARQASVAARAELSEVKKLLDDNHDNERCKHLHEKREIVEKQKKGEAEIKRLQDGNYRLSSKFRSGALEEELPKALEEELSN
ncbi:hypothetical protein LZ31DRAFT_583521 [Colletotrichum somersetense]|nr:hypothetical protein LZ31DRAFT_583521 [Colletotrichum somersetense]